MIESILKLIESANKYGIPIPLILLLAGLAVWASLTMRWPEREKYYYELLGALGKWKDSLSDRYCYYLQPGSEYQDLTITVLPGFKKHTIEGKDAYGAVREQLNVARLFLSAKSVTLLDDLLSEHWQIAEMDAACTKDYLEKMLELVSNSYDNILLDAKKDLQRSRYLAFLKKIQPK